MGVKGARNAGVFPPSGRDVSTNPWKKICASQPIKSPENAFSMFKGTRMATYLDCAALLYRSMGPSLTSACKSIALSIAVHLPPNGALCVVFDRPQFCPPAKAQEQAERRQRKRGPLHSLDLSELESRDGWDAQRSKSANDLVHALAPAGIDFDAGSDYERSCAVIRDLIPRILKSPACGHMMAEIITHLRELAGSEGRVGVIVDAGISELCGFDREDASSHIIDVYSAAPMGLLDGFVVPPYGEGEVLAARLAVEHSKQCPDETVFVSSADYDTLAILAMATNRFGEDVIRRIRWIVCGTARYNNTFLFSPSSLCDYMGCPNSMVVYVMLLCFLDNDFLSRSEFRHSPKDRKAPVPSVADIATFMGRYVKGESCVDTCPVVLESSVEPAYNEHGYEQVSSLVRGMGFTLPEMTHSTMVNRLRLLAYWSLIDDVHGGAQFMNFVRDSR